LKLEDWQRTGVRFLEVGPVRTFLPTSESLTYRAPSLFKRMRNYLRRESIPTPTLTKFGVAWVQLLSCGRRSDSADSGDGQESSTSREEFLRSHSKIVGPTSTSRVNQTEQYNHLFNGQDKIHGVNLCVIPRSLNFPSVHPDPPSRATLRGGWFVLEVHSLSKTRPRLPEGLTSWDIAVDNAEHLRQHGKRWYCRRIHLWAAAGSTSRSKRVGKPLADMDR